MEYTMIDLEYLCYILTSIFLAIGRRKIKNIKLHYNDLYIDFFIFFVHLNIYMCVYIYMSMLPNSIWDEIDFVFLFNTM